MKIYCLALGFLFLLPIIFARTQIGLNHVGYGKTPQHVVFVIGNLGTSDIYGFNIYVDNKIYKKFDGIMAPKKAIEEVIFLEAGKHTIKVKTFDGEEASVILDVVEYEHREEEPIIPPTLIKYKTHLIIGISTFILIIILLILWGGKKRLI